MNTTAWWNHQSPTPVRTIGQSLDYFFQPNFPTKYYGVSKVNECYQERWLGYCPTRDAGVLNPLWACSKPEQVYTPFVGPGETCREEYKCRRVNRDQHANLGERGCIHINEANGLQHAGLGEFWVQWGEPSNNGFFNILFYPSPVDDF